MRKETAIARLFPVLSIVILTFASGVAHANICSYPAGTYDQYDCLCDQGQDQYCCLMGKDQAPRWPAVCDSQPPPPSTNACGGCGNTQWWSGTNLVRYFCHVNPITNVGSCRICVVVGASTTYPLCSIVNP